jgi:hypothetical protein
MTKLCASREDPSRCCGQLAAPKGQSKDHRGGSEGTALQGTCIRSSEPFSTPMRSSKAANTQELWCVCRIQNVNLWAVPEMSRSSKGTTRPARERIACSTRKQSSVKLENKGAPGGELRSLVVSTGGRTAREPLHTLGEPALLGLGNCAVDDGG